MRTKWKWMLACMVLALGMCLQTKNVQAAGEKKTQEETEQVPAVGLTSEDAVEMLDQEDAEQTPEVAQYADVYLEGLLVQDLAQRIYLTESGGYYYFFLPSCADTAKVSLGAEEHSVYYLRPATEKAQSKVGNLGHYTSKSDRTKYVIEPVEGNQISLEGKRELRILLEENGELVEVIISVWQTSQLPALFLSTKSGSMEKIDADPSHEKKESGQLTIVLPDGTTDYTGELKSVKGRGNFTWGGAKKPYNIKLSKAASLLSMDKAKSWCLLANYFDTTLLRNQVVYDMAEALGAEFSMAAKPVDVYLNGRYNGTYQLTEKVEVDKNRIAITDIAALTEEVNADELDSYEALGPHSPLPGTYMYVDIPVDPADISGGYVLELEYDSRYGNEKSGFVTNRGLCVTMKAPECASKAQMEYMKAYFQEFEDAVYAANGRNAKGKHYTEYVDIDSLANLYILQEFTQNRDAMRSSFYFYKETDAKGDGKLHATTAWDFDMSMGNSGEDLGFQVDEWIVVKRKNVVSQLAQKPEMLVAMVQIWNEKYVPYLQELLDEGLDAYYDGLEGALVMNSVRWPHYLIKWYQEEDPYEEEYENLKAFIENRFAFVNAQMAQGDIFGCCK